MAGSARNLPRTGVIVVIPSLMASAVASVQNLSIFDPVSPPAESIRNLSVLVLAITGFIFIAVEGILIYSIVRFRRGAARGLAFSANPTGLALSSETVGESSVKEAEPPQVY